MIKYLVMDVDGTLTDGKLYIGASGEVCKAFSAKDGYGIYHFLSPNGITPVIITGRTSRMVENRCKELGITEIYQGISNKVEVLRSITEDFSTVAYIGDDLNDFACMEMVKSAGGLIGCPSDAVDEIIQLTDFVSSRAGGNGAVREFIEYIIHSA